MDIILFCSYKENNYDRDPQFHYLGIIENNLPDARMGNISYVDLLS